MSGQHSSKAAGRSAIVTGSSRGIGEAIVRRLAGDGYSVCVTDVAANQAGIDALVYELRESYGAGRAIGVAGDVTRQADVQAVVDAAVAAFGALTVMVANAGVAQVAPALEVSEADVRRVFDVNFMGVWHCYTAAARQMVAQGPVAPGAAGYKILGAASIVAHKPFPLLSHYSASKWAVRGLTQAFAMEMAAHKIAVNAYAPGIVGTAMWEEIDQQLGRIEGRAPGESIDKYARDLTAMGRPSVPDDVAKVVGGFLCGPDSDFVTGQTIVVDGGIVFT